MPGFALLFLFIIFGLYAALCLVMFFAVKGKPTLRKLCLVALIAPLVIVWSAQVYNHYPITQKRIVGTYYVDNSFYPGAEANWQREHFYFEITHDDRFTFFEKLADGSYKTIEGKVDWYNSSPSRFRIAVDQPNPLIDEFPTLYRGNRKFYYVFDSKFGNMFYRKVKKNRAAINRSLK